MEEKETDIDQRKRSQTLAVLTEVRTQENNRNRTTEPYTKETLAAG